MEPWTVTVGVHKVPLCFKIDTGADITVIPETVYYQHFEHAPLTEPTKCLKGPGQDKLHTVGLLCVCIVFRTNRVTTDICPEAA